MTRSSRFILLGALCICFTGCYTQLIRMPRNTRELSQGPRPDLAVVDVTGYQRTLVVADSPDREYETCFLIRVVNLGPADFDGSVGFNFADNWYDIDHGTFPYLSGLGGFKIQVGDTIGVRITHGGPYPPETPFRFILRTDAYPLHTFEPAYWFGREPIPEVSLENNVADFILR